MTPRSGFDMIAIGFADVDELVEVDRLPSWGEKLPGRFAGILAGGTMPNVCCAIARLGGRAAWVGCLGDDAGGRLTLQEFKRYGVDTRFATTIPGARTSRALIFLGSGRDRSIVVLRTLRDRIHWSKEMEAYLGSAAFIYLSPHDLTLADRVARLAQRLGVRLALDIESTAGKSLDQLRALLSRTHVASFNRSGLLSTCGLSGPHGLKDLVALGQRVLACGPMVAAITLGSRGALLLSRTRVVRAPAPSVAVVDTTGAGDCFNAALLLGLGRGWPLDQVAAYATAAGALAVTGYGARGRLPTDAEVRHLMSVVRQRMKTARLGGARRSKRSVRP